MGGPAALGSSRKKQVIYLPAFALLRPKHPPCWLQEERFKGQVGPHMGLVSAAIEKEASLKATVSTFTTQPGRRGLCSIPDG